MVPTNNMGYTLQQLQAMGAKPGNDTGGSTTYTADQLKAMGATPVSQSPFQPSVPAPDVNGFAEFGKGIVKGAGSTLADMSRMGTAVANQTAGRVVNALGGKGFTPLSNDQLGNDLGNPESPISKTTDNLLESKNNYQSAGKFTEGAAELLLPGKAAKSIMDIRKLAAAPGKILEILTPKLTAKEYQEAAKAGQTTAQTMFKPAGLSGAKYPDAQHALESVQNVAGALKKSILDIVKPGASFTDNINRVGVAIKDYSQKVISPFLSSNPVPTNFESFIDYMKNVKPDQAIQSSKEAYSTFNRVRDRVVQSVYNSVKGAAKKAGDFGSSTDMNDYWKARQHIDDIIKEELGAKTFTDPGVSGVKAAASTLRRGVADFISDSMRFPGQGEKVAVYRNTVNGLREKGIELGEQELKQLADQMGLQATGEAAASQWDSMMKNANGLYKGLDALGTKVGSERTVGKIGQFAKDHPLLVKGAKAAGWGAAATAGGTGILSFLK